MDDVNATSSVFVLCGQPPLADKDEHDVRAGYLGLQLLRPLPGGIETSIVKEYGFFTECAAQVGPEPARGRTGVGDPVADEDLSGHAFPSRVIAMDGAERPVRVFFPKLYPPGLGNSNTALRDWRPTNEF